MSIFSFKRTLRNVNLTVSAATFDELAGMIEASDGGALNMDGISLVRGSEAVPVEDDPIARHRARVLAPAQTHVPPRPLPPRAAPIAQKDDMVRANG